MKLELILHRDLFLTGENIDVDMELTNNGHTAVDAPILDSPQNAQPVYRLQGPSYTGGLTFNLRDSRRPGGSSAAADTALHRLAPGLMMAGALRLNAIKPIAEPGEYTLSARIEWGGWSAEAAPVKFRVEKAKFLESSLGVDALARSARTLRAVWLADTGAGRLLGESFLYEKRPDLGEVDVAGTRIIRHVDAKASNPFCPWTNFDRSAAMKFWHGWQEGATLLAFSDDEQGTRRFDMGSTKAQLVRPTLMARSGDLEALVLGADGKSLRLARFPAHEGSGSVVAWSTELPEEVKGIRLGIGPESGGSVRVAAAISQSGLRLAVRLIRIGEKSAEVVQPIFVENAFALPESEPAVAIGADGTVHVAVLVASHPGLRSLAIADVTVAANGRPEATLAEAGKVESAVTRAWTVYPATAEGQRLRTWLVRTANGAMLGGPQLAPVAAGGPIGDFLRMSTANYVLAVDANRGPRLVATEF